MGSIPKQCENAKVANCPACRWWCMTVCSWLGGWITKPWCRLAERYGLWTLWATVPLPFAVLYILYALIARG